MVLGGEVKLTCGKQTCTVHKNEMVLLRRAHSVSYRTDIHRVVEENYTSPISLEELAYLSGRSLSSFKRDFQSIYNTTPARWIREKRLSKARQMLQTSRMSVAYVAYSLGFENPTHFSRIFKQQYGVPLDLDLEAANAVILITQLPQAPQLQGYKIFRL